MYLEVLQPGPLPNVKGLGAVRFQLPPGLRGLGQAGCPESKFGEYMTQWLASLQAESQADAGVGCGPGGGQPCTSPSDAAQQQALAIAEQYCGVANADVGLIGCPQDPACSDVASAIAPYVSQAEAFFSKFPASVWSTEAANLASGQFYGPIIVSPATSPQNIPAVPAVQYAAPTTPSGGLVHGSEGGTGLSMGTTTAVLSNTSRPGQAPQVGDSFSLRVTGPANQPVNGSSTQNGGPVSTTPFGATDSTGTLVIQGSFGSSDVGSWLETWQVGNATPAQISFTVSQSAPVQAPMQTAPIQTAPAAPLDLGWLSSDISIGGMNIPVWGLGAAGLLLLLFFPRGR